MIDVDFFGWEEYWIYLDNGYGDCEEYVFEKQWVFLQVGWFKSVILIIVVKDIQNGGYVVFMVCIDYGDMIFDNQIEVVLFWYLMFYCYIKC